MLNGNIKMYNEIAQQKIKGRRELKSSMKLTRWLRCLMQSKWWKLILKMNIKNWNMIVKRKMEKRKIIKLRNSIVDLEDVNNHINIKEFFYILKVFTGKLTCKQCNITFTLKCELENHLLTHKNKRQSKCQHESCNKPFKWPHQSPTHKARFSQMQTARLWKENNQITFESSWRSTFK